eukprot:3669231-Prymnesium_polylepis.1
MRGDGCGGVCERAATESRSIERTAAQHLSLSRTALKVSRSRRTAQPHKVSRSLAPRSHRRVEGGEGRRGE